MRISIDGDACTGHGRCYSVAPALVQADDDGRGVVVRADVRDDLADQARAALLNCPERAVRLADA
jgi:ferredoxin